MGGTISEASSAATSGMRQICGMGSQYLPMESILTFSQARARDMPAIPAPGGQANAFILSLPVLPMRRKGRGRYWEGVVRNRATPAALTALSVSILMYVLYYVNFDVLYGTGASAIIFASFGSSAFVLFMMPKSRSARVGSFVRSYVMGAAVGEAGFYLSLVAPLYVSAGVVVLAMSLLMYAADSLHPPAIAIALAFVLFRIDAYGVLIVVMGAAILIFLRVVLERFVYMIEKDIARDMGR